MSIQDVNWTRLLTEAPAAGAHRLAQPSARGRHDGQPGSTHTGLRQAGQRSAAGRLRRPSREQAC